SYALPIVRREGLRLRFPRATIRGDVAVFVGSATVIGILCIEEDDVFIGLDDPPGRAVPWEPQRNARHDWIVLVRPLIEFLNLVPQLGFVSGKTPHPKSRGRDPLLFYPEVILPAFAAELGVDSSTLHLRWTTSAASITRDWIKWATPDSVQVRLPIGAARRGDGRSLLRGRCFQRPVGRLIRWLDRRLDACRHRHHDIHLSRF